MSEHTSLLEIFPGLAGLKASCGGLDKAYVTDVAVITAESKMSIAAHFTRLPAPAEIDALCGRIRDDYGLRLVELKPDYPKPKTEYIPPKKLSISGGKEPAAAKPSGDILMGRSIKKAPVPMSELTLDSGNVVIEGDVFDVTSRKLQKRDGAVLCVDMTDLTGAILVSRSLRSEDDRSS